MKNAAHLRNDRPQWPPLLPPQVSSQHNVLHNVACVAAAAACAAGTFRHALCSCCGGSHAMIAPRMSCAAKFCALQEKDGVVGWGMPQNSEAAPTEARNCEAHQCTLRRRHAAVPKHKEAAQVPRVGSCCLSCVLAVQVHLHKLQRHCNLHQHFGVCRARSHLAEITNLTPATIVLTLRLRAAQSGAAASGQPCSGPQAATRCYDHDAR